MRRKTWIAAAVLLAAASVYACAASAQGTPSADYPNRAIRLQITVAAGGLADVIARIVTDRMAVSLGQPFVFEHKPGAGGNIAMEATARAAPDGYTLLMGGTQSAINGSIYRNLPYNPLRDLVPVGGVGYGPYALFASATLPAATSAELIAQAKARPGQLNYASVGVGSGAHLAAVLFALAAGIEITHVPTLAETGLPGFEIVGWYMLYAPAGTPREVLARLNVALLKSYGDAAEFEKRTGMLPLALSLDEAARFFAGESEKWGRAVKVSGASAQ